MIEATKTPHPRPRLPYQVNPWPPMGAWPTASWRADDLTFLATSRYLLLAFFWRARVWRRAMYARRSYTRLNHRPPAPLHQVEG